MKKIFNQNGKCDTFLQILMKVLSDLSTKSQKPFTEGEFIKNGLIEIAKILCPEKKKDFNNISFSRNTVDEHVNDIATDLKSQFTKICKDVQTFSIAVDESTDVKDVAQLSVFIRGCNFKYEITEELLEIASVVNFIRARGLNHCQFASLLNENNSEYEDLPYYTEVPWLSCHKVLKVFNHLKTKIFQFLETKEQDISDIKITKFLQDLPFLVDITKQLNDLNIVLQGKNKLITTMFDNVRVFQTKLLLWERQIEQENLVHFETCKSMNLQDPNFMFSSYSKNINNIKQDFEVRFQDFKKC
ncbi:general transcription factor II-I repeat domain-containing protein 2-like [Hydra vulgaris]|uniref:General transcription factor II-I repeat domain-containing protein 2-like n=1 Tax=Hydra vulgaris TaxID=6087 RepID=A0ABM4CTV2_HYDVU